jgi:HK97 gp10 family phage protein
MRVGRVYAKEVEKLKRADEVRRGTRAGAFVIRGEAQNLAPVRTGTLRRSITVVESSGPNGEVEYHVGWDLSIADYGLPVEVGTEDTAAQPHLRTAAIKHSRGGR